MDERIPPITEEQKATIKHAENYLLQHGIGIKEFGSYVSLKNASFMQMDEKDQDEFCGLYDEIELSGKDKRHKGKKLEELVYVLFHKGGQGLLETIKNVRTSSNEIDLIVQWTSEAVSIGANRELSDLGNSFLCECKNYDQKVSVTYVGKFCSLLSCADYHFGIMIAWNGVTGKTDWSDAKGLIKKFALSEKRYIIVLSKNDFKSIYDKEKNLFSLLNEKMLALKNDISFSKLIQPHELENNFNKSGGVFHI